MQMHRYRQAWLVSPRSNLILGTGLMAIVFSLVSLPSRAQDATIANPNTVHVKLDNDKVRVLEAELPPGGKEKVHSHPASVIYVISGGRIRNHNSDGSVVVRELAAGETIYRDPMTHWTENIGTTTVHLVLVEVKTH
jgi:quercetin dioxygenase-like cupin family protein